MPHKHTRRVTDAGASTYDLPPSSIARPLPVGKQDLPKETKGKKRKKASHSHDDTPKAFARVLNYQRTGRKAHGLDDDADQRSSKRIRLSSQGTPRDSNTNGPRSRAGTDVAATKGLQKDKLTILPGERLSDFSARVDQAMPVAGLIRSSKQIQKLGLGKALKERQTKTERRMQRMQAEWRVEEAKRKEKEEEARELAEEDEAEHWGGALDLPEDNDRSKKSKRGKREGRGRDGADDDPWASLKLSREKPRLNDFAQAPPKLRPVKEKLKIKNGAAVDVADVPIAAGSLRKREELGNARREIIDSYRRLMQAKHS